MSVPPGSPEPLPPRRWPAARKSVHDLLHEARAGLVRVTALEAYAAVKAGQAVLVDTRSEDQRAAQGYVREARHHALSVLEWRVCPESGYADQDIDHGTWLILLCREGYSSSLAAARLKALGFTRATDVIDGVDGWIAAGLPIHPTPT
jgi:rhodanese-related sulfurtransferase